MVAEFTFWACLLLVAHTYLLYPLFLVLASTLVQVGRDWRYLRTRQERRSRVAPEPLPSVTLIVPAYNEEARLADKLANLRALDYPRDRLEVIFVSDGSTDRTNEILRTVKDQAIRSLFLPARSGKCNALNRAVAAARHGILVFSDAATLFAPDALRKLVRHFGDPRTGIVCGALQFEATPESRKTEGVYWGYEGMLRLMEARLGVTLVASGAIYAARRSCYPVLPADTLTEDLVVPLAVRRLGFRVLYEPEARATDFAASSVAGEFTRRVRVATGSFRSLRDLVRTPMDPLTAFAFFSHKLLRWVLPFLLLGLLASSAALREQPLYRAVLIAQVLFYLWAALGFFGRRRMQGVRYALIAYYLLAIHLAYLVGFLHFLGGRREATWQRVA
jgi:cellulose synthase/poly-beta-1,6-N-acetylglucosamine synthase-like glycosyltransferase